MTGHIGRREFITLLGGAAAAWPRAARAQETAKLPTIGFLGAATSSSYGQWVAAFVQRLRELGWIEGRTVAIEVRWAEGHTERLSDIAAEFVRLKVDVIVTHSAVPVLAAMQATSVIPIVIASAADPVSTGLVASLAHPGGNVTGLSLQVTDLAGKRVELLREVVPGMRRLAIMANVGAPAAVLEMGEAQAAARTLGLEVITSEIQRGEDIVPALGAQWPRGGTLCQWRPARIRPPDSHQHLGTGGATPDDVRASGARRCGRSHILWTKLPGPLPPRRRVCRQDSARGKAGRHPGRAADQIRSGREPDHREGA
jgi:hypothetical protein